MTLIAALRCPEGVVLASDSRETHTPATRRVARNVTKIYVPRRGFLVGWAGWENVAQAFALAMERADDLSPSLDRVDIRERLDDLLKEVQKSGETDWAEWIVAWWSQPDKTPVALRLFSGRKAQWVETWGYVGDGPPQEIAHIVAEAVRFVPRANLTLEQAKVLAMKVMRDTIHIGVESIGGDVQIGAVSAQGVEVVTGAELRGLDDTLDLWEDQAAALLPGSISVPAETPTPDRGVRVPHRDSPGRTRP